jgi:serine protease
MDEQQPKRAGVGRFLWLFVILAIVVLWWYSRPEGDPGATLQAQEADAVAAATDPDDILVDLKDDVTPAAIAAIEREVGVQLVLVDDTAAATKLYRAHVAPARRDAIIAELARRPEVEIAEPDAQVMLSPQELDAVEVRAPAVEPTHDGYPNDPQYKFQWHLNQIGMPQAWKLADGNGVIVAVLDTGVAYEDYKGFHLLPDLKGISFVDPYDFVTNTKHANDDHGHGSHVTGTIAQVTHNGIGVAGVARNVRIMPLKVLSGSGSGSVGGIADAIRYAADHGAKVINMSLGGAFPSSVLKKAVAYAHGKGVTVVCAAGNESRGRVGYPAAYPGAVAVSATQFDESTTFYSNWGKDIDIAAPGGNTRVDQDGDGKPDGVLQHTIVPGQTSNTDYLWFMGTSMASPHTAGVAALIMGAGVRKPEAVEEILLGTARKPKSSSQADGRVDDHYGAGIVDASAALKKTRDGRGAGELGLAGAVALLGMTLMRRRGIAVERLGPGFAVALLAGSSGLFFLPGLLPQSWTHLHAVGAALSGGYADTLTGALGSNPLVYSAIAPLALTVLLYGVRKLRPALAGFGFGVAGALLFAAVSGTVDVRYVPGFLDPIWLAVHAGVAALFATAVIRKA